MTHDSSGTDSDRSPTALHESTGTVRTWWDRLRACLWGGFVILGSTYVIELDVWKSDRSDKK